MRARREPMNATKTKKVISNTRLLLVAMALLLPATARGAAPGITGTTFNLTAQAAYISQPDGSMIYSWGYACSSGGTAAPASIAPTTGTVCSNVMQVPGPTLIVTQGQTVTINLTNNLPAAAGNTSILFPGFNLATGSSGVLGLLTREAAPGSTVSYSFVASSPGTHAYYSGTQGDLQVEMGLYGAIIVIPNTIPTNCTSGLAATNLTAETHWGESNFRLAAAAYNHPKACYDREHPFHEHGNHVRVLGRDGNLIVSQTDPANNLAGPLLFTTTTTPGQAMDGIFYWTGRGLNWDAYGHNPASADASAKLPCTPDANGYNTGVPTAIN